LHAVDDAQSGELWRAAVMWADPMVRWCEQQDESLWPDRLAVMALIAAALMRQARSQGLESQHIEAVRLDQAGRDLPSMAGLVVREVDVPPEASGHETWLEVQQWLVSADREQHERFVRAAGRARDAFTAHIARCPDPALPTLGERGGDLVAQQRRDMFTRLAEVFGGEN
jgi:hypothetical protein